MQCIIFCLYSLLFIFIQYIYIAPCVTKKCIVWSWAGQQLNASWLNSWNWILLENLWTFLTIIVWLSFFFLSLARYHSIHGYLSLTVCILGCIANVANVVVLTRREIRSPTNAILTGLAVADFLVMIDYIPFSWFDYILPNMNHMRKTLFSYSTAWYIMFHSIFAQICHTISIWLTVTLAVWRYIAVAYPHRNRIWCVLCPSIFFRNLSKNLIMDRH